MKKYYTTFVFEGFDPVTELHCTHAYFGKLDANAAGGLMTVLLDHFYCAPFEEFSAVFDRPDLFGPKKDIPVLRASDATFDQLRAGLHHAFSPWRDRDFGVYQPHVTTFQDGPQTFKVIDYVLVCDKQIIWRAKR